LTFEIVPFDEALRLANLTISAGGNFASAQGI
jgi:hypothetical protein